MSNNNNPIPKADVLVAVPTRGQVRAEWAAMLTNLAWPIHMSHMLQMIPGRSVEDARNIAVQKAQEIEAHYLFFLDDDVLIPNQTLRRMLHFMENNEEWDLISGICPVKTDPPEPCIFRGHRPGPYWGWTFGETFEIDACGMAVCLIRMSAFDKIEQPYFSWTRRSEGTAMREVGEDISFCNKLQKAGGRLAADGGILCGHMDPTGRIYMLDVDTAPFRRAGNDTLKKFTVIEGAAEASAT